MRNLFLGAIAFVLIGCVADCGKPVYRAPGCAGREAPGALQGAAPAAPCGPCYKKPDCAVFSAKIKGFFGGINSAIFGCDKPAPAAVAAPAPCAPPAAAPAPVCK